MKNLTTASVAALALLTGCAGSFSDIQSWMKDQQAKAVPQPVKVLEPQPFTPEVFHGDLPDPYAPRAPAGATTKATSEPSPKLAAQMKHPHAALEDFSLEQLAMRGTILRAGARFALIQADKTLYNVGVGDFIGQHFGRITAITDREVTVMEVVQDSVGEWIERSTSIQIKEPEKK